MESPNIQIAALTSLLLWAWACSSPVMDNIIEGEITLSSDTIELPIDTIVVPSDTIDLQKYSFLALGDSYTIGQGVSQAGSWPYLLQDSLDETKVMLDSLTVIARTGWTTGDLLSAIEDRMPVQHDLVSLLIGVNNQFQNRDFEEFKSEFEALLEIAISLSLDSEKVFVVSIPDYGVTPFGQNNSSVIAQELDKYNTYMQGICSSRNIQFINITEISRSLGNSPQALASDELHPSAFQYAQWVSVMLTVVIALLE